VVKGLRRKAGLGLGRSLSGNKPETKPQEAKNGEWTLQEEVLGYG